MRTEIIAGTIAIIGLLILALLPAGEITSMTVQGEVKSVWKTGQVHHINLQPKPQLKMISFDKAPRKGEKITAKARISEYKGKPELIIESWE